MVALRAGGRLLAAASDADTGVQVHLGSLFEGAEEGTDRVHVVRVETLGSGDPLRVREADPAALLSAEDQLPVHTEVEEGRPSVDVQLPRDRPQLGVLNQDPALSRFAAEPVPLQRLAQLGQSEKVERVVAAHESPVTVDQVADGGNEPTVDMHVAAGHSNSPDQSSLALALRKTNPFYRVRLGSPVSNCANSLPIQSLSN